MYLENMLADWLQTIGECLGTNNPTDGKYGAEDVNSVAYCIANSNRQKLQNSRLNIGGGME